MAWTSRQPRRFVKPRRQADGTRLEKRLPHRPWIEWLEDRVLLAAGDLDTSFGTGGLVDTQLSISNGYYNVTVNAEAIQSDGKIVVVGTITQWPSMRPTFGLVRYLPNGAIDASFGDQGIVSTPIGNLDSHANAVTVEADGKIVVAGSTSTTATGVNAFALVRYNSDGSLDTTFGAGGIVVTTFPASLEVANSLVIQPDQKIVAAGGGGQFDLARYNTDGSLDTTFGAGGLVALPNFVTGSSDEANAVALQSDGKIVVVGTSTVQLAGSVGYSAIARIDPDGSLDTSFGTNGLTRLTGQWAPSTGTSVAVLPDGEIVVGGTFSNVNGFELTRYTADGELDTSYGQNGFAWGYTSNRLSWLTGMALEPDGKIVATGYYYTIDTAGGAYFFLTERFTSGGTLDPTFGGQGFAAVPSFNVGSVASAVTFQSDGRFVLAGFDGDIELARYLNDLYVVANTNDSGPGSLRAAIAAANSSDAAGSIVFDIPGTGPFTIQPSTPLPALTNPTLIDGTSEPGYAGTPLIQLSGQKAGSGAVGLELTAGGSEVKGLAINGFTSSGIEISGGGGDLIQGDFIGTDPTGTVALGNGEGGIVVTAIAGPALHVTIGGTTAATRNVISGNSSSDGIDIVGSYATAALIEGNYIGTDVTGKFALPNSTGIGVTNGTLDTTIGGAAAGAGNLISGNAGYGIVVSNTGGAPSGTLIEGNRIGTDAAGTSVLANNAAGIQLIGATNTTIGGTSAGAGNLVSGNATDGIILSGNTSPTTGTVIQGNRLGTDITGAAAVPNSAGASDSLDADIEILDAVGTTIGGTTGGAGNLISGSYTLNGQFTNALTYGINMYSSSVSGVVVQGNLIGTDATGTKAIPASEGIDIEGGPNSITIGGTATGAGNVISGNVGDALHTHDVTNALVQGNFIGTDITGTQSLSNHGGIEISLSSGITVGGTSSGAGNIIAGNTDAFTIAALVLENVSERNVVQGNFIGTNPAGAALPNRCAGIELSASSNNLIGGTTSGAGNVIANNQGCGVKLASNTGELDPYSTDDAIEGNEIYANGSLGISLSTYGVTQNHVGGPVTGSNDLQNYPVLSWVSSAGGVTQIQGSLNGAANTTFRVEFFANSVEDPSGYGQGQFSLGATSVTTDGTGNASFSVDLQASLASGQFVSATATDPNGNTSEFSQDVAVQATSADLAVTMTASPNPAAAGTDATFVVTASNNGPDTAPATTLSDTLSGAFNVVSVTPSTGGTYTQSGNSITADFGDLASGATATLTIVVSPTAIGSISNAASVSGAVNDPISSNNSTSQTITVESAGSLSFSAASYTASDNSGTATITVGRTGGSGGAVTVQYATSDGTAKAGTDYTATTGTLSFPAGITSETFTVPILNDQTPDGTVSLNLTLSSPTGGATLGTSSTAVLNLTDVPGALQFSSPTYSVSESGGTATITVARADGNGGAVSVQYATSDGTAKAGTDYTESSGTLNFLDGVDSETFTIPILANPNHSGNVTVNLALSNAADGAALGSPSAAVLTITEGAGSLQFSGPTYSVAENGGTANITVTRADGTAGAVTVDYATSDGTAKAGTDYTTTSGTLDFPAGAASETFTVPVLDNPDPAGNTTVNLTLTDPTGEAALGSPSTAVLTIDQGAGDLQFSAPTYTVAENGGTATITVTRTYGTAGAVTVDYATSGGTAVAGTDYTATSGTLNFPAGAASEPITIPILDNPNPAGNVTVDLALTNPTGGASVGTTSTAVLTIDQGAGEFQFSTPTFSVIDNVPTATITVSRNYGTAGAVTVDYATSDGTAKSGTDYTTTTGTLNFPDGVSSQTFTVPIVYDTSPDGTETVNLALTNPTGGASLGSQATAVLDLNDVPGALQFSAANYNVAENAGTATITVTRTFGDGGPVSIPYATSDGTAKAGVDYTTTTGTLDFPDGVATETFTIPILDNPDPSGDVTVNLTLSTPGGGANLGTQSTATLTIGQGAGTLQFSSPTYSVAENGGTAAITVTRTHGTFGPVSVQYAATSGSAIAGTDYTTVSGTLNFPDGVNSETINVPILDNPNPTGDVTVNLALSNPTGGASLGTTPSAVLTIDQGPGVFQFNAPSYSVTQNGSSLLVTVTRAYGAAGAASVDYATSDGTAKAGTDYTTTSGTLDFPAGASSETFSVPILNDPNPNGGDTFNLALSNPTGGATLSTAAQAVATFQDVPGTIQFNSATYQVAKDGGAVTITVTRAVGDGGAVTVDYATSGGSAAPGVEYTPTSGTLSFPDGVARASFNIPILDDPHPDGTQTVGLVLSNPTGGASLGTPATALLTINDTPGALQFSAASYTVQESASTATITVTRTLGDGGPVAVNYTTSDGTAKSGTAYTSTSGTLNFPDGVTSETFTVPILPGGVTTGSEALLLTLSDPSGGASLGSQATATLDIATPPGTLQFSDATDSVGANNTSIILTITRTGGSGGSVAVNYTTNDGTAIAGTDYTDTTGTLILSDGRTNQTLTIPILDNPNRTGSVSFNVTLSDPSGGASLGSITTDTVTIVGNVVALPPNAPQLAAQSDTGVSDSDGLTRDNGSASAPLIFTVSGVSPPNGFVQLENGTNPSSPIPLGSPVQASGGTATITLNGAATTLADGNYQIAATVATSAGGTPSPASAATAITVQTALHVNSFDPALPFLTTLPNNQIVVTFNHWLAGLTPDKADGSGLAAAPFAVMLIPSGPDGLATQKQTGVLWAAPSGYDSGDLPLPATAVYHQNADGTSTITLTPHEPLATDIYLVTVDGLNDRAGNPITNAAGQATSVYTSFDYRPDPTNSTPLNVVSFTTLNGTVPINNNTIPQPDTIAVRFNKPLDQYTVNSSTVQLYGAGKLIPSAVAYSPATDSAYLTPEATLTPGTVYYVSVSGSVSDDGQFPSPGITLAKTNVTSFRVSAAGVGAGSGPLNATATLPANDTAWSQPFGYGAVTFSERIDLNAQGRFSAMLVPQTGGVTTGGSGYADVPYNAKLAFNPNTRQLILVPTGLVTTGVVQLFALSGIKAQNGDTLTAAPGQSLPVYATFLLNAPAQLHSMAASSATISVTTPSGVTTQRTPRDVVRVPSRPVGRPAVVPIPRRVPMGPLGSWRRERGW